MRTSPVTAKKRRTIRMLPTIMDVEVKLSVMKKNVQMTHAIFYITVEVSQDAVNIFLLILGSS